MRRKICSPIICGPILRKLDEKQLVLWWVSHQACIGSFQCFVNEQTLIDIPLSSSSISHFKIGKNAVIHLLNIDHQLPLDTVIEYDLILESSDSKAQTLHQMMPDICYPQQKRCSFLIKSKLNNLLHGSCRNPHHNSDDSLIAGDTQLQQTLMDIKQRPSMLIMSGDQIYVDHVAGPMLYAIRKVVEILGLNDEFLPSDELAKAASILGEKTNYYERKALLPLTQTSKYWRKNTYNHIFTSAHVHNHLISLAEVNAMYLLVWSKQLWQHIDLDNMPIVAQHTQLQNKELAAIHQFSQGLDKVQRLLANICCHMIFDDHDVTDDWNLTAQWELTAYQNPLAKRILGNALFSYWLFQGWGNNPESFDNVFLTKANKYQHQPDSQHQDEFIDTLLSFNQWHYEVNTQPKIIVLDCRTQRWRSESNLAKPSGLMDWESLCHLQQQLIGQEAIILISPAPIFGVKLIESIQRVATMLGQSLAVDAENWMAHPGSANTILNIFRHPKTPKHFVILSGDVHYSFVYEIQLRFRNSSPKIWQITSSGIKNQFPSLLIKILDYMNRYLYAQYSPLNFFTKRRDMKVSYRRPINHAKRLLIEKSGLGYLELNEDSSPKQIIDLHNDGSKTEFVNSKH